MPFVSFATPTSSCGPPRVGRSPGLSLAVGQGPQSNIELTNVITLRDGKIIYQEFFWDHAKALEAAGLRE
jgi:hypothetical protein